MLDIAPTLVGEQLRLDPLVADDRDALATAAGDPAVWAQHPARERYKRDVFDPYFDFLLSAGGTMAARRIDTDEVIGCSRFYAVPDHSEEWAIGFTFLSKPHWGGIWNREMKGLMAAHIFAQYPRLWFHIAPDNLRSQIATQRLGARFAYDADLDLSGGPIAVKCYTLVPEDWDAATPR